MQDAKERGRIYKGGANNPRRGMEKIGQAKLTDAQVIEIRSCGGRQVDVASKFGVYPSVISRIRAGKVWKHVKGGY